MSLIKSNLIALKKQLPENVTLVAVSKTHSKEAILEAYQNGQRIFGENKVQELAEKYEELPQDIQWHFIGHVQTNKIKYMAPFVNLVHGVDREKVLKEFNKEARKNNRIIDCLLQVHIAKEESKFGFDAEELIELLKLDIPTKYPHVRIKGLMGMATFTDNKNQVKAEFNELQQLFSAGKQLLKNSEDFTVLSMGMSGDYELAIEAGSTMVRIGSAIFGSRS